MVAGAGLHHLLERDSSERRLRGRRCERLRLERSALGHDQIRVDVDERLSPKVLGHHSLQQRNTSRSADEDHIVELRRPEAGGLHRVFTDIEATRHERLTHLLELLTRQSVVQIERHAPIAIGEFLDAKLDVRLDRHLNLRPLRGGSEAFVGLPILARVVAALLEELSRHVIGNGRIDVVTSEKRITRSRQHLEHVARELQDRNVEGAATEVVDRDALRGSLVVAVGERGSRGLVENSQHVEARHTPGGLGRASLKLVEVGRNRHDRAAAFLAQRFLGDLANVPKHERADLAQGVGLASRRDQDAATRSFGKLEGKPLLGLLDLVARVRSADEALDRIHGVLSIEQPALFRCRAHQNVTARMKRDDRRDQLETIAPGEHAPPRLIRDRDHGICRT